MIVAIAVRKVHRRGARALPSARRTFLMPRAATDGAAAASAAQAQYTAAEADGAPAEPDANELAGWSMRYDPRYQHRFEPSPHAPPLSAPPSVDALPLWMVPMLPLAAVVLLPAEHGAEHTGLWGGRRGTWPAGGGQSRWRGGKGRQSRWMGAGKGENQV